MIQLSFCNYLKALRPLLNLYRREVIYMDYTLGVDIGTTSVKTVLYDVKGKVHGYSNNGYPLYQDTPDMAEEDPEEIFSAMSDGITEVVRKANMEKGELKGIAFSCAMHSLILLDDNHSHSQVLLSDNWLSIMLISLKQVRQSKNL